MSFTYRPSTGAEILKKKSTAKPTAKILGFIQEHYSSGIVLEPNTDFKNIKILREVENKVSLPVLKRKLISAKIPINGLKISFGNGSGGGKGGGSRGGAEVTALAESLQCYYNSYYWEKGITASEPTEDDLTADIPDFLARNELSQEEKGKVLYHNAKNFYGLQ